jgi:hypothetical protein
MGGFVVMAKQSIPKGGEVSLAYTETDFSNFDSFMVYGFMQDHRNHIDFVTLSLTLDSDTPLYDLKCSLLEDIQEFKVFADL